MKTEVIKFGDFMSGDKKVKINKNHVIGAAALSGIVAPITTSANTFNNLHGAVMNAFDAGVVLVIVFAGASWSLGHRTKAIEILIGVCCGYLIARHSVDIRDFLKGI